MKTTIKERRDIVRTSVTFTVAILVAAMLIFLGNRNDAISKAESLKAGILTAHQVKVAFQNVGGRITEKTLVESTRVKPGDVLMRLDGTDMTLSIRSLDAQIKALDEQIALEEKNIDLALKRADTDERTSWRQIEEAEAARRASAAAFENAKREWQRAKELAPQGAISKSAYDQAQATYRSSNAQLAAAERAVEASIVGASIEAKNKLRKTGSAEGMPLESIANARTEAENRKHNVENMKASRNSMTAELEQLQINEKRLTLLAPQGGKILDYLFEEGDMIQPNVPAVLLETDSRYFDIYVPEKEALKFKPGMEVTAFVPALDRKMVGTVRFCEAAPGFADLRMTRERGQADMTLFKVRIDMPADEDLLTGMTLEVRL